MLYILLVKCIAFTICPLLSADNLHLKYAITENFTAVKFCVKELSP